VNYDNSLVVTITVTCYSWAPSSGDHLITGGAIFWPPHWWRETEIFFRRLISLVCSDKNRWPPPLSF